ncbi:MAG: hypothetical protein Q8878_03000 [Bacillota bacterium]|nr:hypothetical protein [Bacillota bacterium]
MDKEKYKAAIEAVKFSENFERDTIELLRKAAGCKTQKEKGELKTHKIVRIPVMIMAVIGILAATALALSVLMSPREVAGKSGDTVLAAALDSKDAITINKSAKAGNYTVTLLGIVSGKGLTQYDKEVQEDRSYIVASVQYTDGRNIKEAGETGISFTPLVSGYKPWQVNAWTLGGGYSEFLYEGVDYFIFDCSNLEIFADHTVYLAACENLAPSAEVFAMNGSGDIEFVKEFDKPHAMFTLPFDPKKADPAAVSKLLKSIGIAVQ